MLVIRHLLLSFRPYRRSKGSSPVHWRWLETDPGQISGGRSENWPTTNATSIGEAAWWWEGGRGGTPYLLGILPIRFGATDNHWPIWGHLFVCSYQVRLILYFTHCLKSGWIESTATATQKFFLIGGLLELSLLDTSAPEMIVW